MDALVSLLLARGADARARSTASTTPLHEAATVGIARALIAAGADLTARNGAGKTPIEWPRMQRKSVAHALER